MICGRPDGYLDLRYTYPDYVGQGIASGLLQRLEQVLRDSNVKTIFTGASITAPPFFMQHGYTLIAERQVMVRGQQFINFRLQHDLFDF